MVNSRFLYFPTPLKSLPRPAEVLQSPTKTPGEGLREAREGRRRLLLERAWGRPAKGGGDYSWRKSGEAREGSRRLLLEKACGSPQRVAAASPGEGLRKLVEGCGGFFGRHRWKANCGKWHTAPNHEILHFPWVFPHFGQKSWGPPHGS